jgi:Zn finger protein HypA/HybF involved in hydrogenase expression
MGHEVKAKCRKCGKAFKVDNGGGFSFHLVRCNKCGKTKSILFDELGELHLRYLKGLPGPYCIASAEHDKYIRDHAQVEPISETKYHRGVEAIAGTCKCGGSYRFNARPRCPKCLSTQIDEGQVDVYYD